MPEQSSDSSQHPVPRHPIERQLSFAPARPVTPENPRPPFLKWLPWEKLLIWGLFLLVVYTLRHFFLIIFLTFLLSYSLRSFVMWGCGILSPDRERVWLERALTVISFGLVILGFYAVGSYLGPRLVEQGQQLVTRVRDLDPDVDFKTVQRRLLGPPLFKRKYGGREDEAYQEKFRERQEAGPIAKVKDFHAFRVEAAKLRRSFETEAADVLLEAFLSEGDQQKEFERWLLEDIVPGVYAEDPESHQAAWLRKYEGDWSIYELPAPGELTEEQTLSLVYVFIHRSIISTPEDDWPVDYRGEWKKTVRSFLLSGLREMPDYEERFIRHYEASEKEDLPPDYASFVELAAAPDEEEFSRRYEAMQPDELSPEEREAELYANFEFEEQTKLSEEFMKQDLVQRLAANVGGYIDQGVNMLAVWVRDAIKYLFILPVQIALSLLLSLFISFDVPKIRKGIRSLEKSRVQGFYEEIAPGLINFGRLIGRAFQAQGVIAMFNTLFTFAAIKLLGVQNEVFLCAIVFVCSFIPVLGVVLSSVPIAIMALVQPGGDIWLALQAIAAILIIHFIETSVLNPKILGDMLHLHPVMVLAVLAIGEHFFGVWGLLMGVPITVYVIRCVILDTGIPGLIEPRTRIARAVAGDGPVVTSELAPMETDEEDRETSARSRASLTIPDTHEDDVRELG